MANVCSKCTTRYATGLGACPHCGGKKRRDEHDVREPAKVTPGAEAAEPDQDETADPAADEAEPGAGDGSGEPGEM